MSDNHYPVQDEREKLYQLVRHAIEITETIAKVDYPLTSYLLRVAFAALEDETKDALKATAEIEMHYSR